MLDLSLTSLVTTGQIPGLIQRSLKLFKIYLFSDTTTVSLEKERFPVKCLFCKGTFCRCQGWVWCCHLVFFSRDQIATQLHQMALYLSAILSRQQSCVKKTFLESNLVQIPAIIPCIPFSHFKVGANIVYRLQCRQHKN